MAGNVNSAVNDPDVSPGGGDKSAKSANSGKRPPAMVPVRFLIGLFVIASMSVVAAVGFRGALAGWSYLVGAVVAALCSATVVFMARRHRLLLGESVAISLVVFLVLGPIATSGLPTPTAFGAFLSGLINGWADLLSSVPPADPTPELRVLPYVIAWASALVGGEILRRDTVPVLPIVGPVLGLVITLLMTVENSAVAMFQGVALGLGAIILGLTGLLVPIGNGPGETVAGTLDLSTSTGGRSRRRSMLWSIGLLVLIGLTAPALGPRLPLASANERFDLRQYQERPWDPLDEPSPLVTLKASLKEGNRDEVMFRVTSAEPIERFTLAVLASYNGTVWAVADEAGDAPAEFVPVDMRFPNIGATAETLEPSITYEIEIEGLAGPWVPLAGSPLVADSRGNEFRVNRATGTVASPAGLEPGFSYEMTSLPRPELTNTEKRRATAISNDEEAELDLVPPRIRNLAGDIFEGIDAGSRRAVELSTVFSTEGFYDQSDTARPGHSLARIDEFLEDPDRIVGYAEQYAGAAAVLARVGGLPSRVVVGYVVEPGRYQGGSAAVLADDIEAWIEVETVEHGWVPFDVTPDRAREPEQEELGVTIKDIAIPNPPPPPPPRPELRPPSQLENDEDEAEDEEEEDEDETSALGTGWGAAAKVATGVVVGPVVVLSLLGGLVVLAKMLRAGRRRRRHDSAEQIAGAWRELVDRYQEAGVRNLDVSTPTESIRAYLRDSPAAAEEAPSLLALATSVDRAAFHPVAPTEDDANQAWVACGDAVEKLYGQRSRRERMWMRTDPRPLFRPDPVGRRRPTTPELEPAS